MPLCHCGSGLEFSACCQPIISKTQKATTAEALMRARYSAYATHDVDFVLSTTHPMSRGDSDSQAMRSWAEQSEWLGLEIVSTSKGTSSDTQGEVEFVASYRQSGVSQKHHEKSLFVKQDEDWFFKDGEVIFSGPTEKAAPIVNTNKTGRNDPCPCGSGKKFKKCCGA